MSVFVMILVISALVFTAIAVLGRVLEPAGDPSDDEQHDASERRRSTGGDVTGSFPQAR